MAQQTDVSKIQLANRYYQAKDFGKAAVLYNELFEGSKSSYYFNMYMTCLIEDGDYETAEKEIRKGLRRTPSDVALYVQWADLLKRQNKEAEAEKKMQQALAEVPASRADYINLANSFLMKANYD
ncbi:MAG: tetratricopeptide repeat protein, partial [Mangrovibacterium sp.]